MKLLIEDKIMSWLDSFDVFDEIGRKLFRVEAKQDGRRLKIYDPYRHNKSVATLRESDEPTGGVEIKFGSRFVSVVKRVYMKLRTFFDLGFLDWCAVGDFEHGDFRILDANHRTVASVEETFVNHRTVASVEEPFFSRETMRVIDTLPEYVLHSLSFALAVDVQTSSQSSELLTLHS